MQAYHLLITNPKTTLKGWQYVYYKLNFLTSKKKYNKNETGLLVPFEKKFTNNYIATYQNLTGRTIVAAIEVKGFNFTLLSNEEQWLRFQEFQDLLKQADFSISFLKIDLPLNIDENINYLSKEMKKIKTKFKNQEISKNQFAKITSQIKNNIKFLLKEIVYINDEIIKTEKRFFIFVYGKNENDINEKVLSLKNRLLANKFYYQVLSSYELTKLNKLIWNPYAKEMEKYNFEKNELKLVELLKFPDIKIKKDYFEVDGLYYSINNLHDYPLFINDLWGALLFCNEQTIIWNIDPLRKDVAKKALNDAIRTIRTRQIMTKSHINISENNYELETYYQLMDDINGGGEVLKNVNISFLNYAISLKELKKTQARLNSSLKQMDMKLNPLHFQQFEGLKIFIPHNNAKILWKQGREMPTNTLSAAFPFINSSLYDEKGMYLGKNNMGNIIFWDQFKITNERTNHNMFIIGTSGMGKSFTIKKIINHHISMGKKVIVIDPEREYQELCKYYDGDWIDAGNASLGKINPLQVIDNNIGDNDENINSSPLSNHLRFLEQWFRTLYPDFNIRELTILTKCLKDLYHQFQITNETNVNNISNESFPTMSDLHSLILQEMKLNNSSILKEFMEIISTDFLDDGKYQDLWNGYTTIKFKNNFVVYDVYNLFDLDEKKTNSAQLILMLNIIKKEIKQNRFEDQNEIVIIVDEAHLAIDKDIRLL